MPNSPPKCHFAIPEGTDKPASTTLELIFHLTFHWCVLNKAFIVLVSKVVLKITRII